VQYKCQEKALALKKKWKDQIKRDNNKSTLRNMKGQSVLYYNAVHNITYRTIPYHTIPYHTIPYHTIPYHTIPYHTIHTTPTPHPSHLPPNPLGGIIVEIPVGEISCPRGVPPKLWKVLSTHYNPSQLYAIKYVSELESTASTVQEGTSNTAASAATDEGEESTSSCLLL
jgi:hypothetical protein